MEETDTEPKSVVEEAEPPGDEDVGYQGEGGDGDDGEGCGRNR